MFTIMLCHVFSETAAEITNNARIDDLKKIKKILPNLSVILADNLPLKETLRRLCTMGVLDESEDQTINSESCDKDKVHALLKMFHRKSASDYDKLREVLVGVQPDMYDKLMAIEKEHEFQPQQKLGRISQGLTNQKKSDLFDLNQFFFLFKSIFIYFFHGTLGNVPQVVRDLLLFNTSLKQNMSLILI